MYGFSRHCSVGAHVAHLTHRCFFQLTTQFITNTVIIELGYSRRRWPFKPANAPWVHTMYTQGSTTGLKGQIQDATASTAFFGRWQHLPEGIYSVCHCCGSFCVCCNHQLMNECSSCLECVCPDQCVLICYYYYYGCCVFVVRTTVVTVVDLTLFILL